MTIGRGLWAELARGYVRAVPLWTLFIWDTIHGFCDRDRIPVRWRAHTKQPARSRPWPTRPQLLAASHK
jgi:hypothetical protein